jgi:mercuric ion transport protein
MSSPTNKTLLTAGGGVAAAFASALCCAGPLLAVAAGASGAGLASSFEPLRPYFLVATAMLLGLGFYLLRREERNACEPGRPCASPTVRRRMRVMLWTATIISAVFATYPTWSGWVL